MEETGAGKEESGSKSCMRPGRKEREPREPEGVGNKNRFK